MLASMQNRARVARVTGATFGLAAGGALAGSVVGVGWLAALGLAVDGPGGFPYVWDAFVVAASVGAVLGGIGLPTVTWGYLRHVAFGRVVAYGATGTVVGGTVGALASRLGVFPAIAGAVVGFICSTLLLRWREPLRAQHAFGEGHVLPKSAD
jgi:hypothetical protein